MNDLKEVIKANCYKTNGTINGRCNQESWWVKNNLKSQYERILKITNFLPSDTKINIRFYHILNDVWEIPCCSNTACTNKVNWHNSINQYSKFCSRACTAKVNSKTGSDNHFSKEDTKEKIKQTINAKYKVDNFSKTDEFRKKMRHNHASMSQLEKDRIQQKREKTNIQKYGYKTPLLNQQVQEKIKSTLINKYGVDSPLKSNLIQNKKTNTNLQRYGRSNYNQKHLSEETIANLKNKLWLEKRMEQLSVKEISNNLGISYSALCSYIRKAGIILTNYSYLETEIYNFLKELQPELVIIQRDKSLLQSTKQEVDLYLPEYNLAIECNGVYWHGENKGKHKYYHRNKTDGCLMQGVRLVHVFENEWLHKKDIVKNRLRVFLGEKILFYARKCVVKKISKIEEKNFLNNHHLQGYVASKVCYGLYHDNELLSIMSFGKARYNKKAEWELLRYAVKDNYGIVGGAKKLFSTFVKDFLPTSIVSYSDRRWFTGELYQELGFIFSHYSDPNYYYIEKNGDLSSRIKYQKHKLSKILPEYNAELTEWENMLHNGYDRIWDCGNSVWFCSF